MQKYSLRTVLLFGVIALALGVGLGVLWPGSALKNSCHDNLIFVNPSARCGNPSSIDKAAYTSTRNDIISSIKSWKKSGKVDHVSVFFRDLHNSGPTFDIEANAGFSPASLLKVPMAMTYLRLSEEQYPDLLRAKIMPLREEVELTQYFVPAKGAKYDTWQTASELLNFSLKYSDNISYFALYDHLVNIVPQGEDELLRTFKELGILELEGAVENFISVREYSALFRQLYSASYLSPELSNSVLSSLGGLEVGIKGGVPSGVRVASKFGERGFDSGLKQLHDCGIVYYPDNPFIICIMTEGADWDDLSEVIRDITRTIYSEVDSRRVEVR